MHPRTAGFQLIEAVVYLAVLGLLSILGVPPILRWTNAQRVEMAAQEVSGAMRVARAYAVRHATHVGLKFWTARDGAASYALYRDGDGDGVRTDDIRSGVDPQVMPLQRLAHFGREIRFGFPPGRAPRDPANPRRRLTRLDDPIRFNSSDIASFSHLGGSTPGSVYVTDGSVHLSAVRVLNESGRIRRIRYDVASEVWQ
ncbi:MAG: hypothetical protein U0X73_11920 [Thermoanaerobaculia bacterium]